MTPLWSGTTPWLALDLLPLLSYLCAGWWALRLAHMRPSYWKWRWAWCGICAAFALLSLGRALVIFHLLNWIDHPVLGPLRAACVLLASTGFAIATWLLWQVILEGNAPRYGPPRAVPQPPDPAVPAQ